MKILDSSVKMASSHDLFSYTYKESASIEARASADLPGAILTISAGREEASYVESMKEYKESNRRQNDWNQAQSMLENIKHNQEIQKANEENGVYESEDDFEIAMLKRMLAILRGEELPPCDRKHVGKVRNLRTSEFSSSASASVESLNIKLQAGREVIAGTTSGGTVMQRVTAVSGFTTEYEDTTFASTGIVRTADGRSIDFGVEFTMSRAYMEKFDALSVEEYLVCDPLIINVDSNVVSVSDQKYLFDLDADGKKEEISFAGEESGFLAIDKNGDGKINDGSELFGTKSGDGFKDLAAYDEDGNGWIDENDSIFKDLKVWMKDKDGTDQLISIKRADVGAIYLGNADTQFSLKNDEHDTMGIVRKSGVFLKESTGAVGTINHVDLTI
ncbi:MAG: hypothetical protein K6B67_05060 [Lachnospiraceae bacterium]|nr:hypothetical protein [Lachnospiraceae bacterium]